MSNIIAQKWFAWDEKIRFLCLGIFNMAIRYLIFVLLGILFTPKHYQIILLCSWFLSSLMAFYSYKILVFETVGNHLKEFGKSLMIWTLSYFINAALLELMVRVLAMNVFIAQGIAILCLVVVNFLLFKHFAFKKA